jgi:hypothetical protein
MNSKKFGLKKFNQIRDLSEFSKDELDEIKAIQKSENVNENESMVEVFEQKKELVNTS